MFSPLSVLGAVVTYELIVYACIYFWALNSVPLVYLSVFMPVPYCFNYYGFTRKLKIRKCEASCFVLLSQYFSGFRGIWCFVIPSLFFFFLKYLFIYLWLCWVFVSVLGLSPVVASGGHSSSRCAGLSPSRPLLLRSTGSRRASSVIVAHGAQPLRGMWDPPRPGLEPVSPALAGRFSTTAPPGKPSITVFKRETKL